ncbi:MAG: hypothetical protein Q9216_001523 [Gyalolechia sp. 2 TL-2023]
MKLQMSPLKKSYWQISYEMRNHGYDQATLGEKWESIAQPNNALSSKFPSFKVLVNISPKIFFVIFQLQIPPSRVATSGAYYAQLQPILHAQPGFLSEIPYASPTAEGKQVLIARFVDEAAEMAWRLQHDHLQIQRKGREDVFDDYRLRVGGEVWLDEAGSSDNAGMGGGKELRIVALYERPVVEGRGERVSPAGGLGDLIDPEKVGEVDVAGGLADLDVYQGEKSFVWICGWKSLAAAVGFSKAVKRVESDGLIFLEVKRDYGRFERKEAPAGADEAQEGSGGE